MCYPFLVTLPALRTTVGTNLNSESIALNRVHTYLYINCLCITLYTNLNI